jgi:hypothetical protein
VREWVLALVVKATSFAALDTLASAIGLRRRRVPSPGAAADHRSPLRCRDVDCRRNTTAQPDTWAISVNISPVMDPPV